MEVCPLSREVMLHKRNLYPLDYRAAFAFSIVPSPQSLGLALRLAFPKFGFSRCGRSLTRENYGLTTFRVSARVG
jgi:hypothetical protein